MSTSPNLNIPMPDPNADVDDEFYRLQQAWMLIDAILFQLMAAVAGKSNTDHTHAVDQINGLATALNNKMAANKTFKIGDLTDVIGSADAALNYVLAKNNDGKFSFASALSLLGNHDHTIAQVVGLLDALNARLLKSGGSLTGGLSAPLFVVSGDDTVYRSLRYSRGQNPAWDVCVAPNGSRIEFNRFNDAGQYVDSPFSISRANGDLDITGRPFILGALRSALKLSAYNDTENGFFIGPSDGASYTSHNFIMKGWWGMGMQTYDGSINGYYDFRGGWWDVKGGFKVNGNVVPHGGNKATSADIAAGTANKFPDAAVVGTKRPAIITPSGNAFTLNIPAEAQRLALKFAGIQTNAPSMYTCRLGTGGGILTAGYVARATGYQGNAMNCSVASAYFPLMDAVQADHGSVPTYGYLELKRVARGSNKWVITGDITRGSSGMCDFQGGVELASELTQLQISTAAGTAVFSGANSVAIEWEF